jgi:hypothetical protein
MTAALRGPDMTAVRCDGGTLFVFSDDAAFWLLAHLTPALADLEDRSTHPPVALAADHAAEFAVAVRQRLDSTSLEAPTAARLRAARRSVHTQADRLGAEITHRGSRGPMLGRHGSVRDFLDAQYPTLVDIAALARSQPRWNEGGVVDEAYRLCAAIICRSHLLAQLSVHPPAQLNRAYARALRSLGLWAIHSSHPRG